MKPLKGQVAIVTGASAPRGIGRAIALRLVQDGASVVVTDVKGNIRIDGVEYEKSSLLTEIAVEIESGGGSAVAMDVDVTRQDQIVRCINETKEIFGQIDVLVNNAGSLSGSDFFLQTTPEEWEQSFRVNLLGPMMFSKAVIVEMKSKGSGSIVNIGSTGSLGAEAGFGAYTAMKHGLIGMTKTIAAEFGEFGIRCNAVCPGYIMTDMHAAANQRLADKNDMSVRDVMELRYENVALRKAGEPQDVADAVAYLVGPQGVYVTGIALPVAGGVPFGI
ncbi:MAG: SDR family oxidoreductase [Acidiferrobacterales bacterium]|nr:SDR family oxidoreductase [Acidiferrobacterales bacterium]